MRRRRAPHALLPLPSGRYVMRQKLAYFFMALMVLFALFGLKAFTVIAGIISLTLVVVIEQREKKSLRRLREQRRRALDSGDRREDSPPF